MVRASIAVAATAARRLTTIKAIVAAFAKFAKQMAIELLQASGKHDGEKFASLMHPEATYWTSGKPHLFGYAGEPNFGATFLIGVGAYTAALLNSNGFASPWLCVVAGAAMAVVAGVVLALPALRLRGPYFGLVTLVAVLILRQFIILFSRQTGGEIGDPHGSTGRAVGRPQFDAVPVCGVAGGQVRAAVVGGDQVRPVVDPAEEPPGDARARGRAVADPEFPRVVRRLVNEVDLVPRSEQAVHRRRTVLRDGLDDGQGLRRLVEAKQL